MDTNPRHWAFWFIATLVTVIVGTLSHEAGHFVVAKWLNLHPTLHWDSVSFGEMEEANVSISEELSTRLGGVLETLFVGFLAILVLIFKREKWANTFYTRYFWIYLSLFLGREIINFAVGLALGAVQGGHYFGENGDERTISLLLGLWEGAVPTFCFALASVLLAFVFFRFVKKEERIPFLVCTFIGGVLGMWLWLGVFGERILP